MTRINVVPPKELNAKHLVAEYRELPRVFGLAEAAHHRGDEPTWYRMQYPRYVLGEGHVKFFYGRLGYISRRFLMLVDEMKVRGYKPSFDNPRNFYERIPAGWFNEWEPTNSAFMLNRMRIAARLTI